MLRYEASKMIPQDHHEENYSSQTTQIFIPRVLPNQRHRFETEDFFRKSAQTSEVMYQKIPPYQIVRKSQKKSHSTLRAKRATFTF